MPEPSCEYVLDVICEYDENNMIDTDSDYQSEESEQEDIIVNERLNRSN